MFNINITINHDSEELTIKTFSNFDAVSKLIPADHVYDILSLNTFFYFSL